MSTYSENTIFINLVKKIKLSSSGKYSAFNQGVKVPVRKEKRCSVTSVERIESNEINTFFSAINKYRDDFNDDSLILYDKKIYRFQIVSENKRRFTVSLLAQ